MDCPPGSVDHRTTDEQNISLQTRLPPRQSGLDLDREDFAVRDHTPESSQDGDDATKIYNEDLDEPVSPGSTSGSDILSLKERILDALVTNVHGQKFLPADYIEKFTRQDFVVSELGDENIVYTPELVDFASGLGKRLFLTLVQIDHLGGLDGLHAEGFNDTHLPIGLEKRSRDRRRSERKRLLYEFGSLDEGSNTLKPGRWRNFLLEGWNNQKLESFVSEQWLFLAPVFVKDQFRHSFHLNRPLPYIKMPGAASKVKGFFSQVTQARLHDAHQQVLVSTDSGLG